MIKAKPPTICTVRAILIAAGGVQYVASQLDIKPNAIYQWKVIPTRHARKIATMAGLTLGQVRPDLAIAGA